MNSALAKAHEANRLRREQGIELERLDPIQKAARNPSSLRLAITAKCWDCQEADQDPGVRGRISMCPITACPLWNVRPYRKADEG